MQWKSLAGRCQLPDDRHPLAKIDTRGKALSVTPEQSVTAGASSTFWTSDPIPVTGGQLDRVLSPRQESGRDGDGPGSARKAGDERELRCAADGAMPRRHRHGRTSVGPANKKANPGGLAFLLGDAGSPTWARTRDLRINSPALYRLSYRGTEARILGRERACVKAKAAFSWDEAFALHR